MRYISTRDFGAKKKEIGFRDALLRCMPEDGGLYIPSSSQDFRRWILYMSRKTTFPNLVGTLTEAIIGDQFSPIISEAIATRAFQKGHSFAPSIKVLDEGLYLMELWHTPTGSHKDFGIFYLTCAIETIMEMEGACAIFLDASWGELGASLKYALHGKKHIKAVVLYPQGQARGIEDSDLVQNGGNILAIEVKGSIQDCRDIVIRIFEDRDFIGEHNITVANTANIGRLLPQSFFYTYAFTRLKHIVDGDIYYALPAGNYSNVVAGLYAWQMCLPVSGFVIPTTQNIRVDAMGKCVILDSNVPRDKRPKADPADPSNLERLESVFNAQSLMLKTFVYPSNVSDAEVDECCKKLYMDYSIYADTHTSRAYAAALKHKELKRDDGNIVLISRDTPCLNASFILHNLGQAPAMDDSVALSWKEYSGQGLYTIDPSDNDAVLKVKELIRSIG